jgi:hypothetical protein
MDSSKRSKLHQPLEPSNPRLDLQQIRINLEKRFPGARFSAVVDESSLNGSNFERASMTRKYNEGSVYKQASKFNPYLSSSTNKSSSLSSSVEIIISDLEERIDSQSKQDLSPLKEASNENSDDPETVFIQSLIKQKKKMKRNTKSCDNGCLQKIIEQLQVSQQNEKLSKEKNMFKLRMQILNAVRFK